jgi:DUF1009 family protein
MPEDKKTVGLIAGGGQFPLMVAEAGRQEGHRIVAVAFRGETDPVLSEKVDGIVWIHLGQLGQLIRTLKRWDARQALMAGTIGKHRLFSKLRPDLKGLALMSRIAVFHDDGILRALATELEREGIEIISSVAFVPQLLTPAGCLTRRKPTKSEKEDMRLGWRVAKELGRLDIGQCVVVRRKTVLALEAMEGTDETILRGGGLAREKAVVVKVSKPQQDLRFDVPSVGLKTIQTMFQVKASVLALEAGKTLVFDRGETIAYANRCGISVCALQAP